MVHGTRDFSDDPFKVDQFKFNARYFLDNTV